MHLANLEFRFERTVAAGGAFLPYCHKDDADAYAIWCGLTALLFLVLSVSLLPFRAAGYRFVRAVPEDEDHPDQKQQA